MRLFFKCASVVVLLVALHRFLQIRTTETFPEALDHSMSYGWRMGILCAIPLWLIWRRKTEIILSIKKMKISKDPCIYSASILILILSVGSTFQYLANARNISHILPFLLGFLILFAISGIFIAFRQNWARIIAIVWSIAQVISILLGAKKTLAYLADRAQYSYYLPIVCFVLGWLALAFFGHLFLIYWLTWPSIRNKFK